MISLIGLGGTGVKIVKKLSEYEQYKTIEIDIGKGIKEQKTPEDYETNCPSFKTKFKNLGEEVFLFLSASGKISGASLRILEQLKGNKINVVCIHSDPITLSRMGSLQQNVVSGVLQEYARSGLIDNLYLIDNAKIEEMLEDVALDEYWDKINEIISYIFHTMMYFKNTKPVLQSAEEGTNIAKIKTFGLVDQNNNKKLLFDLKHITSETYFYSFSKQEKSKNKNLLKEVKEKMQDKNGEVHRSFKIYETMGNDKTIYMGAETHITQNLKE